MSRHHHHIFHFLLNRELSELYITMAIKSLALAMIGIFIPIFLLKQGFSLVNVGMFYMIEAFCLIIFSMLAFKYMEKYGVKHAIFISIPLLVIFYCLLNGMQQGNNLFYILPIISSLSLAFFWMAFHVDFSKFSKNRHRGEELGLLESIMVSLSIIAPFIGGLLLTFYNFNLLFIIAIILITLSGIPLLFSNEVHDIPKFSFKEMLQIKRKKRFSAFFASGFIGMSISLLWPIFIFNIVNGFLQLGTLVSIGNVFLAFFLIIIGKLADTKNRKIIFKSGVFLRSLSVAIRGFATTAVHIVFFNIFSGISYAMLDIPFMSKIYDKSTRTNLTNFFMFREIIMNLGRISLIAVFLISGSFTISFMVAGLLTFVYLMFK